LIRIDAHHHLWDVTRRSYGWMDGPWADPLRASFTTADLGPLAAASGIGGTVVVQALGESGETEELVATAAQSALIAGVVGWVDLTAPDLNEALGGLRSRPGGEKLVGIRHQVQDEPDPEWIVRPDVLAGLRAVGAAGLAYDLLVKPPQLPAADRAARELPEVRFVVDHLAKPAIVRGDWEPWASGLARLATCQNVTAKISGLVTEAGWDTWSVDQLRPYVRHALDCFGPGRLMFGSDWPVCTLAASYGLVVEAAEVLVDDLSTAERQAVFSHTAIEVYRLDTGSVVGLL
jgi:L-fuconolactonase